MRTHFFRNLAMVAMLIASQATFAREDSFYAFQALRAGGDADIKAVPDGDEESWYVAWEEAAQAALRQAQTESGDAARSSFYRASAYFRTAGFMLPAGDERALEASREGRRAFLAGATLEAFPVTQVQVPFEDGFLPGYLCLVDSSAVKRPLLILQTGFDGTAEELYLAVGRTAVERGYHCLIVEGPGQGAAARELQLPFRPDWESVITPITDYAVALPQLDPERLALMGVSLGGYLVPRALAFEHRIAVGIANGGPFDFHKVVTQNVPQELLSQLDNPYAQEAINDAIFQKMAQDPQVRWAIQHGMYTFGASDPAEWFRMTRDYHLSDIVQEITAEMLIVDSENDEPMRGQAEQLYDALHSPKSFMLFTAEEGAGEHCQVGAYDVSNKRIFDWLDQRLLPHSVA